MEASGLGDEAIAIQAAFRAKDHDAMVDAVSDRMLDEMAAAGTLDEVRDRVALLEKRYDHAALLPELHHGRRAGPREHPRHHRGLPPLTVDRTVEDSHSTGRLSAPAPSVACLT
jgi:hypothetical protein